MDLAAVLQHPAMHGLGVGKRLADVIDLARRNACRLEPCKPGRGGRARHSLGDKRDERRAVGDPHRIGGEALVVRPFWHAQQGAEAGELRIVSDRDDQWAIGAGKGLIGDDIGVAIALALRIVA